MKDEPKRKAVVMLVEDTMGRVLFTKRSSNRKYLPGVWALPAGHIDSNEEYKETAIRESSEELDIEVTDVELLEKIEEPGGDNSEIYVVRIKSDSYTKKPKINNDEFEKIEWLSLRDFYKKYTDDQIGSTLRHLRNRFS